jgi:hypothetical protein
MRKFLISSAALVLSAQGIQAQSQDLRFGVQLLLSSPSSDLRKVSNKESLGGALTLDWQVSEGHVLRPRVEFISYPEKTSTYSYSWGLTTYSGSSSSSAESVGVGLDYVYYFAGKPQGWHLDGGVENLRYKFSGSATDTILGPAGGPTTFTGQADAARTKLGFALGVGYDFNRAWGVGLRFTSVSIENARFEAYNFGASYRF